MIRVIKLLGALILASGLAACGGGGGSPGTNVTTGNNPSASNGSTSGTVTPTLTLTLVDSADAAVSGNSVSPGSIAYARAVVKDNTGSAVASKLVTFTSANGSVVFQPASGQVLTDTNGVAKVQVAPASISTAGADTITANTTIGTTGLTAAIDVQTSPANLSLGPLAVGQTTLSAFQSTSVGVDVLVNGAAATNTTVPVTFTANCGAFSPVSATSNSNGRALSTFQATGCVGGNVTLSAAATGATPVTATVVVQPAQATNILFVSAAPTVIYTSAADSGVKQSTVKFKVVDAGGNTVGAGTQVQVSLSSSAIAAGVVFADTNTSATKTVSSDVNGEVSVIVKSGAFPTPLALTAALVSNPAVTASSGGLSVDSGRAVQNFFSLSASVYNIEGWRYDGEITSINVLAADRLAQPLPAGTPVSFIAEGGQVSASCQMALDSNNKSGCAVSLASQASRPANGRITVLAYMEGDEVFVDANGNNRYDAGETFYDMGQPFLDSNENGVLDTGEQRVGAVVPGSGIGSLACTAQPGGGANPYLVANIAATCDGAWGPTRVRDQRVIVLSDSFAISQASNPGIMYNLTSTGVTVRVVDINGNPLPYNTKIEAALSGGTNCSLEQVIPAAVLSTNALGGTDHRVIIKATNTATQAGTCTGAELSVKATTPKNNVTLLGSVIIP